MFTFSIINVIQIIENVGKKEKNPLITESTNNYFDMLVYYFQSFGGAYVVVVVLGQLSSFIKI